MPLCRPSPWPRTSCKRLSFWTRLASTLQNLREKNRKTIYLCAVSKEIRMIAVALSHSSTPFPIKILSPLNVPVVNHARNGGRLKLVDLDNNEYLTGVIPMETIPIADPYSMASKRFYRMANARFDTHGLRYLPVHLSSIHEPTSKVENDPNISSISHGSGRIGYLIINVQGDSLKEVMERLRPRLDGSSTILFLNKSFGFVEEVSSSVFPDIKSRPTCISAFYG